MALKAVANVGKADVGGIALDPQWEEAVHGDVGGEEAGERVTRHGNPAERRPDAEARCLLTTAVAADIVGAAHEAEGQTRSDVRGDREEDEEGFGDSGLIDLAGLQQVGLRGRDGAGD